MVGARLAPFRITIQHASPATKIPTLGALVVVLWVCFCFFFGGEWRGGGGGGERGVAVPKMRTMFAYVGLPPLGETTM